MGTALRPTVYGIAALAHATLSFRATSKRARRRVWRCSSAPYPISDDMKNSRLGGTGDNPCPGRSEPPAAHSPRPARSGRHSWRYEQAETKRAYRAVRSTRHRRLDTGLVGGSLPTLAGVWLVTADRSDLLNVLGGISICAGVSLAVVATARWGTPSAQEADLRTRTRMIRRFRNGRRAAATKWADAKTGTLR